MGLSNRDKRILASKQIYMSRYSFPYHEMAEFLNSDKFINMSTGNIIETPQLGEGLYVDYIKRPKLKSHIDKEFVELSLTSKRLDTLKHSNKCVCCGLEGVAFKPSMSSCTKGYRGHINLYSNRGVLFTVDHLKPQSMGGRTEADNLATCCIECNNLKGSTYKPWSWIREQILRSKGDIDNLSDQLVGGGHSTNYLTSVYERILWEENHK